MVEAGLDGLGQAALGRPLERLGVVDHGLTVQELACRGRRKRARGGGMGWGVGGVSQKPGARSGAPDWMRYSLLHTHTKQQLRTHVSPDASSPSRSALLQRAEGQV